MKDNRRLSDRIAEQILTMISVESRYKPGEQLPNEHELSEELKVSRTTLREALRILAAHDIIEIKRGKGTFVKNDFKPEISSTLVGLTDIKVNTKDLFEMRLIFEPEAAYYATLRATDQELEQIFHYGRLIEEKIKNNEDRTEVEQKFHRAIANATHNVYMEKLMPVLYQAIDKGVVLSQLHDMLVKETVRDHQLIMEFMAARNAEGAKSAMKIHILHAMKELGIDK